MIDLGTGRRLTEEEWSATCDDCGGSLLLRFDEVGQWRVYDSYSGLVLCGVCLNGQQVEK